MNLRTLPLLTLAMLSCTSPRPASKNDRPSGTVSRAARSTSQSGDIIAEVGSFTITAQKIRSIMNEYRVSPERALHAAIINALLYNEALKNPESHAEAKRETVRQAVHDFEKNFRLPPASDSQVREIFERLDSAGLINHPQLRRAAHVVVKSPIRKRTPDDDDVRLAYLNVITPWVKSLEDDPHAVLSRIAEMAQAGYFEVSLEELPPVALDNEYNMRRHHASMDTTFLSELFSMDATGQLSAPFLSAFGAHVVELMQIQPAATHRSLSEAAPEIRKKVRQEMLRHEFASHLEKLRKKYGVRIRMQGGAK